MTGLIVFDLYELWRAKLAVVPSQALRHSISRPLQLCHSVSCTVSEILFVK